MSPASPRRRRSAGRPVQKRAQPAPGPLGGLLAVLAELVRAGALLLAAACAFLTLAAQGGRFSDRLDAITHVTPILLTGAVLAVLAWLTAGRRGAATPVMAAVAAVASLALMAPELLARQQRTSAPAAEGSVKIVQFNVWGRNRDADATARWLSAQKADVIVLEEAFARSGGVVRAIRADYPYASTCDDPYPCSTVILSKRRPIAEGGLEGPHRARLKGAWATYRTADGPFTVVGVHYTWPWPAGPQQQQTLRLAKAIEPFPKDRLIVAGDFNSTPWSFSLARQDAQFGLERRTRALFSWPAGIFSRLGLALPFPVLPIDHIYAGRGWATASVSRGPKLGSDHYPVVVELTPRR